MYIARVAVSRLQPNETDFDRTNMQMLLASDLVEHGRAKSRTCRLHDAEMETIIFEGRIVGTYIFVLRYCVHAQNFSDNGRCHVFPLVYAYGSDVHLHSSST